MKKLFLLGLVLFMNIIPICAAVSDKESNLEQVVTGEGQLEPKEVDEVIYIINGGRFISERLVDFSENVFLREAFEHKGENVLLSPAGLYTTLSLLSNGTSGNTRKQLLQILGFEEKDQDFINWYNNTVINILNGDTAMCTYNSVWTNGSISKKFQKVAEDKYLATAAQIPFDEEGAKLVNGWVKDRSHGLIPKILEKFDNNTEMVLINTSVFNGVWEKPGEKWKSSDFKTDGKNKIVDFIKIYGKSFEINGAKGFSKRYHGDCCFVGLLPDGNLYEFLKGLDFRELNKTVFSYLYYNVTEEECRIYIPTFNLKSKSDLKPTFKNLGCDGLFHYTIDLGGVLEKPKELCVSTLLQSNAITLNEVGTKAASATMVEMVSFGNDPYMLFNKPFLYFIIKDGIILYAGLVNDPAPTN